MILLTIGLVLALILSKLWRKDDEQTEPKSEDLRLSLRLAGWLLFFGSSVYALGQLSHGAVQWLLVPLGLLLLLQRPMFLVQQVFLPKGWVKWTYRGALLSLWLAPDRRGQALLYGNLALLRAPLHHDPRADEEYLAAHQKKLPGGAASLVAAACLSPGDYFAINVPPKIFAGLGLAAPQIDHLSQLLGEELRGRTGGSVSLAAGMSEILRQVPGATGLLDYFYHFIVMFEAVFILTTVDAGTRVARFLVQDVLGRLDGRFQRHDFKPGVWVASLLVVAMWGGFLYTGTITTLWPLLGIANQLLSATALAVGTAVILRMHPQRRRYALFTAVPMVAVGTTTLVAGWESIFNNFLRLPSRAQALVDTGCTAVLMLCALGVMGTLLKKSLQRTGPRS